MNESLITAFIIVSSVAIVIQACILIAMYVSMKKSSARVEAAVKQVEDRAVPLLDAANSLLNDNRQKIDTVVDNLVTTTNVLRSQVERLDLTVTDIVDRTRLQVNRTDEMISRTLDRVEETTDIVHHSVLSPVRQLAGVVQGVMTGIGAYFGRKLPREGRGVQDEEMFI
jgi:hypothetical protein